MMKKRMVLWFAITAGVGAFALLARAGSEPAQAVEPAPEIGPAALETFVAVDQVTVRRGHLAIQALPLGGSDVVNRTYTLPSGGSDSVTTQGMGQRCERLVLLMLTKPGAYQLDMDQSGLDGLNCTLRRNE
jgi:hypothetical protein